MSDEEFVINENAKVKCNQVLKNLAQLIGNYYLYIQEETAGYHDDPSVVQEEYMQKLFFENFSRYKETLVESLKCEDYEEQGLLELSQLQEAIMTVNEELDHNIVDYMLYYVFMRSENPQEMQYKNLIELLDSLIE